MKWFIVVTLVAGSHEVVYRSETPSFDTKTACLEHLQLAADAFFSALNLGEVLLPEGFPDGEFHFKVDCSDGADRA
jgi:hypothetical protein